MGVVVGGRVELSRATPTQQLSSALNVDLQGSGQSQEDLQMRSHEAGDPYPSQLLSENKLSISIKCFT